MTSYILHVHCELRLSQGTGSTASGAASGAVSAVSSPASEELRKITQEETDNVTRAGQLASSQKGEIQGKRWKINTG